MALSKTVGQYNLKKLALTLTASSCGITRLGKIARSSSVLASDLISTERRLSTDSRNSSLLKRGPLLLFAPPAREIGFKTLTDLSSLSKSLFIMASSSELSVPSKRVMSTSSQPAGNIPPVSDGPSTSSSSDSSSNNNPGGLSKTAQLKKAVKDYGATVIVFHIAISLTSLGFFYVLVSSGLDPASWLKALGVGESILESKITQGASTFVIAYAVHKVFAPVRITITLTATPFIVRYLRGVGILKKPVS